MVGTDRLLVHTGFACNNRCIFCAQGDLRRVREPVSDAAVTRALSRASAERVAFIGGEPTLRDELPAWIRAARRAGARQVVVQTNARRLAYRAYAASLARAGVTALDVSLQGPRAEVHDHHTRVEGSFQQTVAGLSMARAARIPLGVNAVITRSSFRNLTQLVRRVAGLGATRLRLAPARALGEAARLLPRVVPRLSLVRPHLLAAAREAASLGLDLELAGVPPCLLRGRRGPTLTPTQAAGDLFGALADRCRRCAMAGRCPGVDPGYLAHHGAGELRPLDEPAGRGLVPRLEQGGQAPALQDSPSPFAGLGRVELAPPGCVAPRWRRRG